MSVVVDGETKMMLPMDDDYSRRVADVPVLRVDKGHSDIPLNNELRVQRGTGILDEL